MFIVLPLPLNVTVGADAEQRLSINQPSRPVEPVIVDGGMLIDVIIFPAVALNLKYWQPEPHVSLLVAAAFPAKAITPVVPSL